MSSRAPTAKVGEASKDGRRIITVTYHADGDYPQAQLVATAYRAAYDGAPNLRLDTLDTPPAIPSAPWQILAPIAEVLALPASTGPAYTATWRGVTGTGSTPDDALADLYHHVCRVLDGVAVMAATMTAFTGTQQR